MSITILVMIVAALLFLTGGIYLISARSVSTSTQVAPEPVKKILSCGPRMVLTNGVCVPEIRYLSGFGYANCDQKYIWSQELDAYINETQDRALVVKDKQLTCYPVEKGKIQSGNYGTRVLDVEVVFGDHPQTDIPEGTERTLSGYRYANCDGHYRWSVDQKAFINDERNRALTVDGPKLMCRDFKGGNFGGSFGTRVIGAEGVEWI